MTKVCNDFKVSSYYSTGEPDVEKWKVIAGGQLYMVCRVYERAVEVAKLLNLDPYFLERGNTQLDRANMQAPNRGYA